MYNHLIYYYCYIRYVERRRDSSETNVVADSCRRSSADSVNSEWLTAADSLTPRIVVSSEEEGSNGTPTWMVSPELLALQHNLNFPDSATASPVLRRAHRVCRKFSVDLSKQSYPMTICFQLSSQKTNSFLIDTILYLSMFHCQRGDFRLKDSGM